VSPQLAQNGLSHCVSRCPLIGAKQKYRGLAATSVFDPKATSVHAYGFDHRRRPCGVYADGLSQGPYRATRDCACRKSNPNILVVQPAQDRAAKNGPGQLDGARDRRILLQR